MPRAEYKFFGIKLNYDKDADMICFMESKSNKQKFIKGLILKEMLRDTYRYGSTHARFKEWEDRMNEKR